MKVIKSTAQNFILASVIGIILIYSSTSSAQEENQEKEKKHRVITEEVVVEAKLPRELPISTTSSIKGERIESLAYSNLSEVLSYTSGTFISSGLKNEFSIKIRGFESQRIALLYDGIPIYEPFFNSFDLKTITAEEVAAVKIVKGASSVLYGPNALGGVVDIITKRPSSPSFSLKTLYDSNNSLTISSSGAFRWKNVFFSGFGSFDRSEGFHWMENGKSTLRENSDYQRGNITGKAYFYPSQKSEVLLEAAYYSSEFGIPYATEYYSSRYWRFKNWNRFQFNLGGTFSLLEKGYLKLRGYYVRHGNILDSYKNSDMNELMWESTYKNHSYGAFLLGSFPYSSRNELKFSLNLRDDNVRTQDDRGLDWEEFEHRTISLGVENHFSLSAKWKLVAGASYDYLNKQSGDNKGSLNPVAGIKFNPTDFIDLHLTFSQKSRFPSMKSLYSSTAGNPNLKDEKGTNCEFGLRYEGLFLFTGAIFYNKMKDLINAVRLPDGHQTSFNIGKSRIVGFELELQKSIRWLNFSVNSTFLEGKNEDEDRPLDLLPKSQLNFVVDVFDRKRVKFTLWGLAVSGCEVRIFGDRVKVPGYFVLNASLSRSFANFAAFLRVENLLNRYYTPEPGFPMKARTIVLGLKFNSEPAGEKSKTAPRGRP
jgi:iron complex outermembrane receptor protein